MGNFDYAAPAVRQPRNRSTPRSVSRSISQGHTGPLLTACPAVALSRDLRGFNTEIHGLSLASGQGRAHFIRQR